MVIRWGILGAAAIAPRALIHPARSRQDVQVVAVAARDRLRAQAYAFEHGVARVHIGYESLLAAPDLDAVYIALPNSLHAGWARAAAQAGKHVLVEKPLATDAAQAQGLRDAVQGLPLVVREGMHYACHPLARRLWQLVDDGAIGELRHVDIVFQAPLRRPDDIRYQRELAGGALMDLGCYALHLARRLLGGMPVVERAEAQLLPSGVDRRMIVHLTGAAATARIRAEFAPGALIDQHAVLVGSRGRLMVRQPFMPGWLGSLQRQAHDGSMHIERFARRSSFHDQLDAFVRCVQGDVAALPGLDDAVQNMRLIDAAYAAAGLR